MSTELAMPAPSRVGQGTAVEQSRAVAEVHAAIVVAQQVPRNINRAVADMQRSCAQKSLAERAFFRYSRGGEQISGPSVQLARELGRCWGNLQYGITELRRDDAYGQSEMQAWAWDVQTNARSSTTFIVQHVRDTKKGTKQLTDQRDIYENNANNGARRLREMIFAILPGWYTEDAITACYQTLEADNGDGTLAERIAKAVDLFGKLGVTSSQLEQKIGAPRPKWAPYDLAQLHVIYRSIQRGETRKEEEFDTAAERVTAAEIMGNGQTSAPAPDSGPAAAEPAPPAEPPAAGGKVARAPLTKLKRTMASLPLGTGGDMYDTVSALAGRRVGTLDDLSPQEARHVQEVADKALEDAGGDVAQAAALVRAQAKTGRPQEPVVEDPPADLFPPEDAQ